jgi:hypothetical protein
MWPAKQEIASAVSCFYILIHIHFAPCSKPLPCVTILNKYSPLRSIYTKNWVATITI